MTNKFLVRLISELSEKLPELSMSKIGLKFRKILEKSSKTKPSALESCTMLMEIPHVSNASYCVTNILTPRKAATLAGVTSLEFWSDEKEMTEEDFYEENDDLKADLQKMSLSLKRAVSRYVSILVKSLDP